MDVPLCNCGALLLSVGGIANQGDWFFQGKRYLCLKCGALHANAPREQASTPEAEAKISALETEFMVNCGSKLFWMGMFRLGCERCERELADATQRQAEPDPAKAHIQHATQNDWREINDALKWISDRTGKEFGMVNGDLGHYQELMSEAKSPTSSKGIAELLRSF